MTNADLERIGLTAGLPAASIDRLAALVECVEVPQQVVLFREGLPHSRLYWVQSGLVRLEMTGTRAASQAMLTVGPYDLLAWSATLGAGRMTATAITVEPTKLLAFDATSLSELCEQDSIVGFRLMNAMAKAISLRLVATRLQLLDLFQHPAEVHE